MARALKTPTAPVLDTGGSIDAATEAVLQKTELATRAVDMLLFSGEVGTMVQSMGGMMGLSQVSIALLLPTKRLINVRPFLVSVNSIISTALDGQCSLEEFTKILADNVRVIQQIVAEEK